jgi:precorrin-4 methylase/DMSO/TMAO reductase YedYZ molybdopterin-dependent catalytic subunit
MKKTLVTVCFLIILFVFSGVAFSSSISVTGVVNQPLNLSMDDLKRFESVSVRLNEVRTDKSYHGAFNYYGVPLKTLLEIASIQKGETDFFKLVDLAIAVRNKEGKQVVLSWGEVFYRNPADIVVAVSATPVMPLRDCKSCHQPEVFESWYNPLKRQIGFPKLIVTNDFYTDRSIEDITNIEVVDLQPKIAVNKQIELFSPEFSIMGAVKQTFAITDLSSYPHIDVMSKEIGDGRGYHGLQHFQGVSLLELLRKAGIEDNLNTVILVSAPDGYRSLVSYGELLLNQSGKNIIIADKVDDKPLKKQGKFNLIFPDDLSADRLVKAVNKVEVISLKDKPKLYVIGVGCGDTNLLTLEAISYMGKADVFVCAEDIKKRFSKYMGDKPILFDPLQSLKVVAKREELDETRAKNIHLLKDALNAGKSVAYLDWGDPSIYGSWRFLKQHFEDETIEVIPGISAFNAASASIKRDIGCNGSIIITVPKGLKENSALLKSVAEHGDTIAIFMGLKELKDIMPIFQKYYPNSTPVALVYHAGYALKEHLIRTTLDKVSDIAKREKEKWLGLIYISPCLK